MKKITTLMVMLVGCICSALAQTVATTATAPSDIENGYYMLVAKSDNDNTDATGNYVYTKDGYVWYEAKGSETNFLGKTLTNVDQFIYLFYVEKDNNGKVTFRAWNDNRHWKDCGEAAWNNRTPWDLDQFPLSSSTAHFGINKTGDFGCYIVASGSKRGFGKNDATDYYVTCCGSQQMGYKESSNAGIAQFKFYAVSNVPEAKDMVSFSYNYTMGEHSIVVSKGIQLIGSAYPEANDIAFLVTNKPTGTISADDNGKTFTIECTEALPFEVSTDGNYHYYYLENVQGEGTRLSSNNGLNYRTSAQATTVNGVRNDLWYVTGNPFDGFRFYSVGENKEVQSNAVVSHPSLLSAHLSFSGVSNVTKVWDLIKNENGFGVCSHVGSEYATSIWPPFPTTTFENHKEYSWKYNSDRIDFEAYESNNDAFAFRLIPATFTYALYNGGDGHTYNTFSAPFDVKVDGESDVKLYKGTADYEAKTLKMDEVAAVPAGAGVLLMGDNSEEVTFVVTSGVAALEGNALIGSTSDVTDLSDKLILGRSETTGEVGFYAAADGVTTLYANHAYLMRRSADSQLEGLSIRFGGEPTGINQLPAQKNDVNAPIYDLSGRRVLRTVKGQLYIQSGRKFMAR